MKKYVFAFLIWVMIIPIAILNGGFREYVLVNLGVLARPLSGIILSVCIFIVAYLLVPKIKNCVKRDYITQTSHINNLFKTLKSKEKLAY